MKTMVDLYEYRNRADEAYFNSGEPIMTDEQYDDMISEMEQQGGCRVPQKIGASVVERKVRIPFHMGSLDKMKNDNDIQRWTKTCHGPYVVSPKLDGVSLLLVIDGGGYVLYTRGDGDYGQDVSHLAPFLKLPLCSQKMVVRGEVIFNKDMFHKKKHNANARNIVSGIVNRKSETPITTDEATPLNFVAYEMIEPRMNVSDQMEFLKKNKFLTVPVHKFDSVSVDVLCPLLTTYRRDYIYEIDGLVVCPENVSAYPRCEKGNPSFMRAFKIRFSDQIVQTRVIDIEWNVSKDGKMKPRVLLEPINIQGNLVSCVSGFHAAYVVQHQLGKGAVVEITRSGDVIPVITSVVHPAPSVSLPDEPCHWNETRIDLIIEGNHPQMKLRRLERFFQGIGIKRLGARSLQKLINAHFDTIPKIINISTEQLADIPGFGEQTAHTIVSSIQDALRYADIPTVLASSNIFGNGISKKTLQSIFQSFPDILSFDEKTCLNSLQKIKGIGEKTRNTFIQHRNGAHQFLHSIS